jgi:hypothetical protein
MKNMFRKLNTFSRKSCFGLSKGLQPENSFKRVFLKGLFCLIPAVLFLGIMQPARPLEASEWMFQQSYFSHNLPAEVAEMYPQPESRYAYRRAYANFAPGVSVRGEYRYNTIILRNGNSTDVTVYREDWFQFQP